MKQSCKTSGCPVSACAIPVIALFIFLSAYNTLVHGHLLMDEYKATAALWRTPEEMNALAPWWMGYYALLSAVLACWFKKSKSAFSCAKTPEEAASRCPIKSGGCCFGLKLGLLMGLLMASSYLYMPIPSSLAIKWFFTGLFEGLGAGMVLGITCRGPSSCDMKSPE